MSEPSSRQERLRALIRKRNGQPRRDALAELVGDAPRPCRIVEPPEADPLVEALFAAVGTNRRDDRLVVSADLDGTGFQRELERVLGGRDGADPVVLTVSDARQFGLVEATVDLLRTFGKAILDHDRDSLVAAGPDGSWGLVGQRFEGAEVTYQLEHWPR